MKKTSPYELIDSQLELLRQIKGYPENVTNQLSNGAKEVLTYGFSNRRDPKTNAVAAIYTASVILSEGKPDITLKELRDYFGSNPMSIKTASDDFNRRILGDIF